MGNVLYGMGFYCVRPSGKQLLRRHALYPQIKGLLNEDGDFIENQDDARALWNHLSRIAHADIYVDARMRKDTDVMQYVRRWYYGDHTGSLWFIICHAGPRCLAAYLANVQVAQREVQLAAAYMAQHLSHQKLCILLDKSIDSRTEWMTLYVMVEEITLDPTGAEEFMGDPLLKDETHEAWVNRMGVLIVSRLLRGCLPGQLLYREEDSRTILDIMDQSPSGLSHHCPEAALVLRLAVQSARDQFLVAIEEVLIPCLAKMVMDYI